MEDRLGSEERRHRIVESLEAEQEVTIPELSARFSVSEMTIRRDLDALAAEGLARRTYGGAVLAHSSGVEPRYASKQKVNAASKARIARYAASELVDDGDIILLEGGTTVTAMAQHLRGKRDLTVLTNGLYTANELLHLLPGATILSTGGILRDVSFTYVGPSVDDFLRQFHGRTLFVSATGFTLEHGFTDPNPLEAQVRRSMAASADRIVALLDSSKFGVVSFTTVAPPDGVDILVTNTDAPVEVLDELRARGIDVRLVP